MELSVHVPEYDEQSQVNRIIFEELCQGEIDRISTNYLNYVVESMAKKGAKGVVLGCTELQKSLSDDNCPLPTYDTMYLHAKAAVDYALNE